MNLESKKTLIHERAAKFDNHSLLDSYTSLERITMWYYHNDNKLSLLSSNFDVERLPEREKQAADPILSNKEFIAVLIDKMLNHDSIISYSMYRMLYQNIHPELIIKDGSIFESDELIAVYISKGGNAAALAEMNAELWLNSKIGESYLFSDVE